MASDYSPSRGSHDGGTGRGQAREDRTSAPNRGPRWVAIASGLTLGEDDILPKSSD